MAVLALVAGTSLVVLGSVAGCGAASAASRPGGSGAAAPAATRTDSTTTAAPRLPKTPRIATDAVSALALALPVLFRGTPDLVVRNTHSVSYVATTAGAAAKAVGSRWTGPGAPSTPAWLVVGTAVVGPTCRCNPPRPETVWAIVERGRNDVDAGASVNPPGVHRLVGWNPVPYAMTTAFA